MKISKSGKLSKSSGGRFEKKRLSILEAWCKPDCHLYLIFSSSSAEGEG